MTIMTNLGESKIYDPYDAGLEKTGGDRFRLNQLHDKLKKLPTGLQDFIFSTVPGDFIKDRISTRQGLNENQSRELAILVLELTLADVYLGNIVNEIKNRLGIDNIKAKTIAGLIVAELFGPILEELKKMHIEKFARGQSRPAQSQSSQVFDDRVVDLR